MTIFHVTLTDGQMFWFDADLVQAAAPITVNFHDVDNDADWQPTPYQTASAQHCEWEAAKLLAVHFALDDEDCVEVFDVDLVGGDA